MRVALLAAIALLLVACGGGGGSGAGTATPQPLLSGVDVDTVEGPTCPVQQQGQTCSKPFAAAVVVTRADGSVAARITTSTSGRGHIPLSPGAYTIGGEASSRGLPRPPAAQQVTVPPDQFVAVQLSFDTGIR